MNKIISQEKYAFLERQWPFDLEVDGICYRYIRGTNQIMVTSSLNLFEYRGDFIIPHKVTYREREYIVTAIGENAFYNTAIFTINMPDSITRFGDCAFKFSTGLENITIPKNVQSIGDFAFKNCNGLMEIIVEAPVPPICGEEVFENIPKTCKLIVPEASLTAYREAAEWKNLLI